MATVLSDTPDVAGFSPRSNDDDSTSVGLQRITHPTSGWINPFTAARTLWNTALRTALIEVDGQPVGTGVLIGEDLLLTAHHVLSMAEQEFNPSHSVCAVFDYAEVPTESPAE